MKSFKTFINEAVTDDRKEVAKELKKFAKKYVSGPISVTSGKGKTAYVMLRAKGGGEISNELRKMVIDKAMPKANPSNMDDISYGNVTKQSIAISADGWKKVMGLKESVEHLDEMQPHGMFGSFGGQKKKSTLPSRPTRIAVDKEFAKVTRSGKMDTMAAKKHLEKKFKITDVRIEKDKNGKPHVTYFQESVELGESASRETETAKKIAKKGKKLGDWVGKSYYEYEGNLWVLGGYGNEAVNRGPINKAKKTLNKSLLKKLKFNESVELDEAGRPEDSTNHPKNSQSTANILKAIRDEAKRKAAKKAEKKTESVELGEEPFVFPDEEKAKQFDLDVGNSAIGTGNRVGNRVTVTGVDSKYRPAIKKFMKKSKGKFIKDSVELDEGLVLASDDLNAVKKTAQKLAKQSPDLTYYVVKHKTRFLKGKEYAYYEVYQSVDMHLVRNKARKIAGYGAKVDMRESVELDEAKSPVKSLGKEAKAVLAMAINMSLTDTYRSGSGPVAHDKNLEFFGDTEIDAAIKFLDKNSKKLTPAGRQAAREIVKTLGESVELDEAFDMKKMLKIFNKLKKNDTVKIKYDSSISKGKDFQTFVVTSPKKTVGKAGVERVIMKHVNNPTGVKYTLYNRKGSVSLAIGDMAASMTDIQESVEHLDEGTPAYRKAMAAYKNSDTKKVFDILKKKGFRVYAQSDTLVRNMLKKNKGNVQKAAAEIEKKYPGHFK
jgi:hypothetical protein